MGPVFRLLSSIHGHVTHNIWSFGPLHLSNVTATLPCAEKKDHRSQARPDLQSSRPTRCACFDRRKSPMVLTLPCFLELLCTASSFGPEDSFRSISEGFFESLIRGTGSGLPSENSIREAWSSPFRFLGPSSSFTFVDSPEHSRRILTKQVIRHLKCGRSSSFSLEASSNSPRVNQYLVSGEAFHPSRLLFHLETCAAVLAQCHLQSLLLLSHRQDWCTRGRHYLVLRDVRSPPAQFADENSVALPALIDPRCANHSDTPYPYALSDTTGGPTAFPTGSGIFPPRPTGTGSLAAGSNTTLGPKGQSGSGFASASHLHNIANLSDPTAGTNSGRTRFITGLSGVFPLPTFNASIGGTGSPSSGASLLRSYPYLLNLTGTPLTGTAIRPTARILTVGASGTGVVPGGTDTGVTTSTRSSDPFGNSSSARPFETGSVTGAARSSNKIYGYLLPPVSSVTGVASASSLVASSNSSIATVASSLSISSTLTSTIAPSLLLSSGSASGPSSSNITSPTGVGNSSLSGASPSTGPATSSDPLLPYYPYLPLVSGTIASGTDPVTSNETDVPNTLSTGTGGPFLTTSASLTDRSVPPTSDPTDSLSVIGPTSQPATPTSSGLNSGSGGFGPSRATSSFSGGIGGSSFLPTTFDTSIKSTGTISQNVVPTEYFYHHRRPHGYGSVSIDSVTSRVSSELIVFLRLVPTAMALGTTSTLKTTMHSSEEKRGGAGRGKPKAFTMDNMGGLSDLGGRPCVSFPFSFHFHFRIRIVRPKSAVGCDARLIRSMFSWMLLCYQSTTVLDIWSRCNIAAR